MLHYRSTREAAIADVGRAIAMAAGGALVFAPVEYALTVWDYAGSIELTSALKLAALVATLSLLLWLLLAVVLSFVLVTARLARAAFDPDAGRARGWLEVSPASEGVRAGVPVLWAAVGTGLVVGVVLQRVAVWTILNYKEPQLTGGVLAAIALGGCLVAVVTMRVMLVASRTGASALAPVLEVANPLGRWRAAIVTLAATLTGALAVVWLVLPQSRSSLSIRLVLSAFAIAHGMGLGAYVRALPRRRARKRLHAGVLAAGAFALSVVTLWRIGGDPRAKYVAITASPALDKLISLVRVANDLDRDGFGSLLGENDCAPLDNTIHPGARDIPDDGIDQNCDGHDYSLRAPPVPTGPSLPVPAQFKKDWNILFITVDTLRYDHTSFGGYRDGPKHRDTTPRLAELVSRAVSFTFCQAPSAGTMASIPAIITSRYFHSGIALDENMPPGTPPKLKPENTLLSEIMKRGGYHTGVIASHEYWNDWGMDQGVDEYDNSIGKTPDPFRVAADKVTEHALAWISRQQGRKWFLWAHYIDPHGRYVAHPDVVDYGSSEPDLYDAEIRWTDQEIGKLLDELVRMPSNDKTIIVLTSDHGDSMGEHTVPLGTHGTALYRELQHVPMIFYIPDNTPRQIGGAVTNLDILPTLAELAGIDIHDLQVEGKSLVPSLFYGKEDHDRIVFAETNAPTPQRAAISEKWKLIHYLQSNIDELYDLTKDPWEHENLAPARPPEYATMKGALDAWLERVVYARDPTFNQADERFKDVLLKAPPHPVVATTGQRLDAGRIEILGIGADKPLVPGGHADVHVYFKVGERTQLSYKFLLAIWPVTRATWKPTDAAPSGAMVKSPLRATADGFFPTDRWHTGEYVRERFGMSIPSDWKGDAIAVGLVAVTAEGEKAEASGPAPANDPNLAVLGALPLGGSSGSAGP